MWAKVFHFIQNSMKISTSFPIHCKSLNVVTTCEFSIHYEIICPIYYRFHISRNVMKISLNIVCPFQLLLIHATGTILEKTS